jgi:hypothetical protein
MYVVAIDPTKPILACLQACCVSSMIMLLRLAGMAGASVQEQAQHSYQHGGGHNSSLVLEQK